MSAENPKSVPAAEVRAGAAADPEVAAAASTAPDVVHEQSPASASAAAELEVRDLHVRYPARRGHPPARAVDGVNLRIGRGEIVALIGESGCGKSTLARTLVGLIKPTGGQVLYQGTPLEYSGKALKHYRRQVQLVLQDPGGALNPKQNVYDAVAEGPRLHRLREGLPQTVHGALAKAGLRPPEDFTPRYPHELSGGQQQRVVIAGALALNPSVLVADEPVASLDASVRGEILKLLLDLRAGLGLSALVVSHDLGLAWNIADRVAVMYLGRVVEQGPVEEVLLRPRHPYTQALLSVLPDARPDWRPTLLTGEPPDPTAIPSGCRFHPRCPRWAAATGPERAAAACDHRELPVLPAAGPAADPAPQAASVAPAAGSAASATGSSATAASAASSSLPASQSPSSTSGSPSSSSSAACHLLEPTAPLEPTILENA